MKHGIGLSKGSNGGGCRSLGGPKSERTVEGRSDCAGLCEVTTVLSSAHMRSDITGEVGGFRDCYRPPTKQTLDAAFVALFGGWGGRKVLCQRKPATWGASAPERIHAEKKKTRRAQCPSDITAQRARDLSFRRTVQISPTHQPAADSYHYCLYSPAPSAPSRAVVHLPFPIHRQHHH